MSINNHYVVLHEELGHGTYVAAYVAWNVLWSGHHILEDVYIFNIITHTNRQHSILDMRYLSEHRHNHQSATSGVTKFGDKSRKISVVSSLNHLGTVDIKF